MINNNIIIDLKKLKILIMNYSYDKTLYLFNI